MAGTGGRSVAVNDDDRSLVKLALAAADLDDRLGAPARAGLLRQLARRVAELAAALGTLAEGLPPSGEACLNCRNPIEQKATGRPRKWCSERCRNQALRRGSVPRWVGATSYATTHRRVKKDGGKAVALACSSCGEPAREWAFNHDTSPEFVRHHPDGMPYSARGQVDYIPLCVSCHRRYDRNLTEKPSGKLA